MNDTKKLQKPKTARQTRCLRAVITLCVITDPVSRLDGFSPTEVWGGKAVCQELVVMGWLEDRTHTSDLTGEHSWFAPSEALEAHIRDLEERWDAMVDEVMGR